MTGGYIDDQVKSLRKVGISGAVVGRNTEGQYVDKVQAVDYLVLMGSPISEEMLEEVKQQSLIKHVVLDLKEHGDPIHAGMSFFDPAEHVPLLGSQMTESSERKEDVGHFYYGIDGPSGEQRRLELAQSPVFTPKALFRWTDVVMRLFEEKRALKA